MSIRALLVDDHDAMRQMLREILERAGYVEVVGETGDGTETLRVIDALAPDVVVLDLHLHGMEGYSTLRALAAMDDGPKVVALSNSMEPAVERIALAAGAKAFVPTGEAVSRLAPAVRSAMMQKYQAAGLPS